jgi:hypothetical protein
MKMPKGPSMPKVKFNMAAAFPADKAVKAGKAVLSAFAHHPPSILKANPHFERPHGGKGPKN